MKNLFENTETLAAIVAKIENMSCSFKRNEQKEVMVDIEASFDVDKVLVNIREDLILYGEDKFLPHGEKKFSFILEQMKEIRKTFDYIIESFTTSFSPEGEKLIMKITCSLNVSKFKRKGKEVLSSKRKKSSCSLKELEEEIKRKHSDEDLFKKFFGDKGDLF